MNPTYISRYEIKSELGRGGMATVYLGYDPRFRREVAIKVLPREFLHDPQFRARFEREAQTIAMLDHPAIVPVYDFGEEDGLPYLVMRLMTGGSLAARLKPGPLSLIEAARLLSRLAPALDEAHAHGVIHRDLKPANILFDQRDDPYLSDFGIVKLTEASAAFTGSAIIGTPAYMSPEQVRGEAKIDGRSDTYALGVILFEMLTGKQPYEASTPIGVAFKHVTDPVPRVLDFNPGLPLETQAVIERAMAKAPGDRFATASTMAGTLTAVASGTATRGHFSVGGRVFGLERETPAKRRLALGELVQKLRSVFTSAPGLKSARAATLSKTIAAKAISPTLLPAQTQLPAAPPEPVAAPELVIAPPQPREAVTALPAEQPAILASALPTVRALPARKGQRRLWLAVGMAGFVILASVAGLVWSANGNATTRETSTAAALASASEQALAAVEQSTATPTPHPPTATVPTPTATFTPSPIPPTPTRAATRTPLPPSPSPTRSRKLVRVLADNSSGNYEIYAEYSDGSRVNLTNNPAYDGSPSWSRAANKIAFHTDRDGNNEVYLMNTDGSGQTNLTMSPADDYYAAWSPDGTRIAFQTHRDGPPEIYVMNADGSGQTNLTNNSAWDGTPAWSPDGTRITFYTERDGNSEIYVMTADGSGQTNLTNNLASECCPAWLSDGSIRFLSNRDGSNKYYVMNADGSNVVLYSP